MSPHPPILEILLSDEMLEIGRKAIEDALVEFRDGRISELSRGNGFVIRERDGKPSPVIRFGPETGISIALKAMFAELDRRNRA